jgi:serine protease Do
MAKPDRTSPIGLAGLALALGLSASTALAQAPAPQPAAQRASDVGRTLVLDVPAIVEQVDNAVVSIDVAGDDERGRASGIVIDKAGLIVTNFHVIALGEEELIGSLRSTGPPKLATSISVILPDGRSLLASVKGFDRATDLALLSVNPGDQPLPEAKFGDSDALRVGEWVVAIGNPLGLEHTVTLGIISGKGRAGFGGQFDDFLQTDAAINPGNSGGPLVNARGEVIGINTLIIQPDKATGLSFAIPINLVRDIVPQLASRGRVTRGMLGIESFDASAQVRHQLNLPPERTGILVDKVERGTPAARAGIRKGDFIFMLDRSPVVNTGQFNRTISRKPPGTKVELTFMRDGKEYSIQAEIAAGLDVPEVPKASPND